MAKHEYRNDTQLVLMGNVRVAKWRNELRHLELSLPVATALLAKVPAEENELGLSGADLIDLAHGRGEITNYVKLSGAASKVRRTFTALTRVAWEHDVPSSVDEVEPLDGDEYFDSFMTAYPVGN